MNRLDTPTRRWIAGAALAAGLFCTVVALIPAAERFGIPGAWLGRLALAPACHQIPDRCLDLGAGALPVCARCAGLYVGGFLGLLVSACTGRSLKPGWKWVGLSALPSVVDFGLGVVGLPDLPNWPRFFAAVLPAILVGLLVADALRSIVVLNSDAPDRVQ